MPESGDKIGVKIPQATRDRISLLEERVVEDYDDRISYLENVLIVIQHANVFITVFKTDRPVLRVPTYWASLSAEYSKKELLPREPSQFAVGGRIISGK